MLITVLTSSIRNEKSYQKITRNSPNKKKEELVAPAVTGTYMTKNHGSQNEETSCTYTSTATYLTGPEICRKKKVSLKKKIIPEVR